MKTLLDGLQPVFSPLHRDVEANVENRLLKDELDHERRKSVERDDQVARLDNLRDRAGEGHLEVRETPPIRKSQIVVNDDHASPRGKRTVVDKYDPHNAQMNLENGDTVATQNGVAGYMYLQRPLQP